MEWLSRFRKQPGLAGLDMGSSAVKVAELCQRRGGLELAHLGIEPLPPDVVVDSMVADSDTLAGVVAKLLNNAEIGTRAVVAGVSGNAVIVRTLVLPVLPEPQRGEAVRREAALQLPFVLEDLHLDYDVLFEPARSGQDAVGQTMDVLLCAARKEKIMSYKHVLASAGCTAEIVDVDMLALQNCYEYNYQPGDGTVVALLNVGASTLNLSVLRGIRPLFQRDIAIGGNHYTDALEKEFDLSPEDAEKAKLQLGDSPKLDAEAMAAVFQQVNQIVALEVRKTLDFFRGARVSDPIERMYLAGGCARVPGLAEALEKEFSVAVEGLNPFRRIALPKNMHKDDATAALAARIPEQLAVAVGLALRSFDNL